MHFSSDESVPGVRTFLLVPSVYKLIYGLKLLAFTWNHVFSIPGCFNNRHRAPFLSIWYILIFTGLAKSGSQMSASFTSTGRHIVSVGEDSRVYVWNYDDLCVPQSKKTSSVRSCEHFFSEGVSVAIPWSSMEPKQKGLDLQTQDHHEASSWRRDSKRFSLSNCFSMDGSFRGSVTWPEEKLPLWDVPVVEDHLLLHNGDDLHRHCNDRNREALSDTWGLVIVTAGWDGVIRTFHNFGLPTRI